MRIQGAAKWKSRDRLFQVSEFEGRDVGTAMARALIDVARASEPSVMVTAQTSPLRNALNSLLEKLGFKFFAVINDPEDGEGLGAAVSAASLTT